MSTWSTYAREMLEWLHKGYTGGLQVYIPPHLYRRVLWLRHVAAAYPLAPRKLRKCHQRKITRRMQRDRKRLRYETARPGSGLQVLRLLPVTLD